MVVGTRTNDQVMEHIIAQDLTALHSIAQEDFTASHSIVQYCTAVNSIAQYFTVFQVVQQGMAVQ